MKTLIIAVLSFSMLVISAESVFSFSPIQSPFFQDKTKIKKEDLPEAARKKLDSDEYKQWSIVSITKLQTGDYQVELKKGETTHVLSFNKDGGLIKE